MFVVSRRRHWTPRYFSGSKVAREARQPSSSASRGSEARSDPLPRPPRHGNRPENRTKVIASSSALLSAQVKNGNDRTVAAVQSVLKLVPQALWDLEQHSRALSSDGVLATSFAVKRDVLGPLSLALPSPPARFGVRGSPSAADTRGDSPTHRPRLKLVSDGEVSQTPIQPKDSRSSTTEMNDAMLSLEDVVLVLLLYNAVESEDGILLQQLLTQVDRFLSENARPLLSSSPQTTKNVRLPLPALLLALSQVGIAVEHTLERIIRRPAKEVETHGLLYAQLRHYDMHELLQLLAGLHRFGFHQHYAFERTVKELQIRWQRPRSADVVRVQKAIRQCARQRSARGPRVDKGDSLVHSEEYEFDDEEGVTALRGFVNQVGLPDTLRVDDTRLFVEALTGLSLSVFRRLDAVSCVANVFVLNAVAALDGQLSHEERHLLSQHLHRAVHLCESMELEQPLLADVFGLACSAGGKGILFDGGEDTDDVPTERRAYYDHVTADLVKVNHL